MPDIRWRTDAGLPEDRSALTACTNYFRARLSTLNLIVPPSCSLTLGCSEQALLSGVQNALADPGVEEAFAGGPTFYGTRRAGKAPLTITSQGRELTVAEDCEGISADCIAVPPALKALAEALRAVDLAMMSRRECASTFDRRDCETNAECPAEFHCWHGGDGFCTGSGKCNPRPIDCTSDAPGGCSCDGVPYATACDAYVDGREIGSSSECLGTGLCALPALTVRGTCDTSFGWVYAAASVSTGCVELRGCECVNLEGAPCGAGTPLYGSKAACERAHATCSSSDE